MTKIVCVNNSYVKQGIIFYPSSSSVLDANKFFSETVLVNKSEGVFLVSDGEELLLEEHKVYYLLRIGNSVIAYEQADFDKQFTAVSKIMV